MMTELSLSCSFVNLCLVIDIKQINAVKSLFQQIAIVLTDVNV